jgi:hypothetical protein
VNSARKQAIKAAAKKTAGLQIAAANVPAADPADDFGLLPMVDVDGSFMLVVG